MKSSSSTLPVSYRFYTSIDMQHNKKLSFLLNAAAFLVFSVMFCIGQFLVPVDGGTDIRTMLFQTAIPIAMIVSYLFLHEFTHGLFIRLFSGRRSTYGFTGIFACAGSDCLFEKAAYIVIALAPVFVWEAILASCALIFPTAWFWMFYIVQIANVSGSVGDFYVTLKVLSMPDKILVRDTGTDVTVFTEGI